MPQESDDLPPSPSASSDTKRALARCLFVSRILLYITYILGFALAIWILYALIHDGSEGEYYAFAIAGVFVGLSVPLTLHDINLHLLHYVDPLQAQVMRILWMVPVYSIESWLALVYRDKAVYLKAMVACYESYVLYSFFQLMLGSTGGKLRLSVRLVETGKDRAPCVAPCCCLRGWKMGNRFVHRCTVGVYQYVFINTIVAFLQIITESNHRYKDGVWDFRNFYPWASLAINCSQMTALFVLAYFYVYTHDWLYPIQPLFKLLSVWGRTCGILFIFLVFTPPHYLSRTPHTRTLHSLYRLFFSLVVKAVIFVSWWQGLGISIAHNFHLLPAFGKFSQAETAEALQNFAICIEMFLAAIGHHFFFSYKDYYSEEPGKVTPRLAVLKLNAEFDAAHPDLHTTGGSPSLPSPPATSKRVVASHGGQPHGGDSGTGINDIEIVDTAERSSYGAALVGMMPVDVVSDTGKLLTTGFGLTHKWEKRKQEEQARTAAMMHEMSSRGWEAADAKNSRTQGDSEEGYTPSIREGGGSSGGGLQVGSGGVHKVATSKHVLGSLRREGGGGQGGR